MFAQAIAIAVKEALAGATPTDRGKRLPVKAPESFDGSYSKFRLWWETMRQYLHIQRHSVPDDETKILSIGTYLSGEAKTWFNARLREAEASHQYDDWKSFSSALVDRFTDQQEVDKDHDRLLALRYEGSIQTFLARFGELNSRVGLSGEALRRALRIAITPAIHDQIHVRYGVIPKNDHDLILAIREAGVAIEDRARSVALSKGTTRSSSDKAENKSSAPTQNATVAVPRKESERTSGKPKGTTPKDQKKPQPKEQVAGKAGEGPRKDFSKLRKAWANFFAAVKGVSKEITTRYKEARKACIRCGSDNHGILNCVRRKTIDGEELPAAPEAPASTSATKRKHQVEERTGEDEAPASEEPSNKAQKTAAASAATS